MLGHLVFISWHDPDPPWSYFAWYALSASDDHHLTVNRDNQVQPSVGSRASQVQLLPNPVSQRKLYGRRSTKHICSRQSWFSMVSESKSASSLFWMKSRQVHYSCITSDLFYGHIANYHNTICVHPGLRYRDYHGSHIHLEREAKQHWIVNNFFTSPVSTLNVKLNVYPKVKLDHRNTHDQRCEPWGFDRTLCSAQYDLGLSFPIPGIDIEPKLTCISVVSC